jgi:tetratricopeptide (TPR) repeat protein
MRALALVIALAAAPAIGALAPPDARAHKELGDAARRDGDAARALASYRAAVLADPRFAEAYEAMGEVQYAAREYGPAMDSFTRALEIDPGFAVAWYNLGHVSRKTGALERARTAYERYVALAPGDPDGHLALAETLRGLGDEAGAAREYRVLVELARGNGARAGDPAPPVVLAAAQAQPGAPASPPAAAPPASAAPAAASRSSPAPQAAPAPGSVQEKLVLGDRLFAAGDHRGALFAYQDAVYLDPKSAAARVKLGRAYAALRYPEQAAQQFAQALAIDPENADAKRAIEEAKNPPARPTPRAVGPAAPAPTKAAPVIVRTAPTGGPVEAPAPAPATAPAAVPAPAPGATAGSAATPPRIYRIPEATPDQPVEAPRPVGPETEPAVDVAAAQAAQQPPQGLTAAQRYRAALVLLSKREYAVAVSELNDAIAQDPRLAVAYAARGSAQFGLARYREAADDYKAALGLAPELATPLYGLGESYRLLGDGAMAAEYYARYAESGASDVREDLRATAKRRAAELGARQGRQ